MKRLPNEVGALFRLLHIGRQKPVFARKGKALPVSYTHLINFYLSYEVQNANALDGVDAPVRMDVVLTEDQVGSFVYGCLLYTSRVSSSSRPISLSRTL